MANAILKALDDPIASAASHPAFQVVSPTAPAPAPVKKGGLKLGAIGAAPKKAGGKSYAVVANVDPAIVSRLLKAKALIKRLDDGKGGGLIPSITDHLMETIRPAIHQFASGNQEDSISVIVRGNAGKEALVTMSKRYKNAPAPEDGDIGRIVGPEFAEHFTIGTTLKIDLEKVSEEQRQTLVDAIVAAAETLGCVTAIEAKEIVVPVPGFHARRRLILTPDQNAALDARVPLVCSIRAR